MNTYINQKINEIAKSHGLKTIEERLPSVKEPDHYYSDMPDTPNPRKTIEKLQKEIKELGFEYFFEADEERKGAIAQVLTVKSAQLIKTVQA